jgi:hypothetical protein
VHVHRGEHWFDVAPDERIPLNAWQDFVEQEPDFRLEGNLSRKVDGGVGGTFF